MCLMFRWQTMDCLFYYFEEKWRFCKEHMPWRIDLAVEALPALHTKQITRWQGHDPIDKDTHVLPKLQAHFPSKEAPFWW